MAPLQRILQLVTVVTIASAYGATAPPPTLSESPDSGPLTSSRWGQSESESKRFLSRNSAYNATEESDHQHVLKNLPQSKELREIYTRAKYTLKQLLNRLLDIDNANGTITTAGLYEVLRKFGVDSLLTAGVHLQDQELTDSQKNVFALFNKADLQGRVENVVAWYKREIAELMAQVRSILNSKETEEGARDQRVLEMESLISLPALSFTDSEVKNAASKSALRRLQVLDVIHQLNPLQGITPLFGSLSEADRELLSTLETRLRNSKDRVVRDLVFGLNSRSGGVDETGMRRLLQKVGLDRWLSFDTRHPSIRLSNAESLVLQTAQKRPHIINRIQQQYEREVSRAIQNLRQHSALVQQRSHTIATDGIFSRTYKIKSLRRLAASGLLEHMNSLMHAALPARPVDSSNSALPPLPSLHAVLSSSQPDPSALITTPQLRGDIDLALSTFLERERLESIMDKPQLLQVLNQVRGGAPQLRDWTDLELHEGMAEQLASAMPFEQFLNKLKVLSVDLGLDAGRQQISPSLRRGRRLEDQTESLPNASQGETELESIDGQTDSRIHAQDSSQRRDHRESLEQQSVNEGKGGSLGEEHSPQKSEEEAQGAHDDTESQFMAIRSFFDDILNRMPDILESDSWEDEDDDIWSEGYTQEIGENFEKLQTLADAISVLLREYEQVLTELQLQLQAQFKMSEELGELIDEKTQEVSQQINKLK